MGKFKIMTEDQVKEINDLLRLADKSLDTGAPVIMGNPQNAKIVGTAIGGVTGAAIAASAGTMGVTGAIGASGLVGAGSLAAGGIGASSLAAGGIGAAGAIGAGALATVAAPLVIGALVIGGGIGYLVGENNKSKEVQKQKNYVKDLTIKQQKLYEQFKAKMEEMERNNKQKDDIIKAQAEKLAEYEALIEAIKNARGGLELNLANA